MAWNPVDGTLAGWDVVVGNAWAWNPVDGMVTGNVNENHDDQGRFSSSPGGSESHSDKIEGTQKEADREVTRRASKVEKIKDKIDKLENPPHVQKLRKDLSDTDNRIAQLQKQLAESKAKQGKLHEQLTKNEWNPVDGLVTHGGAGSGNFGHEGRPGEIGGSGGGTATMEHDDSKSGIAGESTTPPPPGHEYNPDVEAKGENGVTLSSRVGVPGMEVPPPPNEIGKIPNLTPKEREVESSFAESYLANPDKVASDYRQLAIDAAKPGEAPVFETDAAKGLTDVWDHPGMSLDDRSANRSLYNVALHQTANAVAKNAFIQHLDTLKPGDELLVTVGGCGAGKGFSLKNVPEALSLKQSSKVVWDSAGDQCATENPWIQKMADERGLKVNYVFVHADPYKQWADPERGVVHRAEDPKDGRMVDAKVFADSYAIGARNHQAFYEANKSNPNANFVFIDGRGKPTKIDGIPKDALSVDRDDLAKFANKTVHDREGSIPDRIVRAATMNERIWTGEKPMTKNERTTDNALYIDELPDGLNEAEYAVFANEADQRNKIGELASKRGLLIKCGQGKPPELNIDGSYKTV